MIKYGCHDKIIKIQGDYIMTPKKKCLAWAFGTIIVAVVFAVGALVAFAFLSDNSVGYVVGLIAAAFAISFFICGFVFLGDANRLYCSKCGAKYDYDNVAWEVGNTTDEGNKLVAEVDFEVHCPYCGENREYTRKYTVSYRDNNGNWHENNLSNVIRKQYKGK